MHVQLASQLLVKPKRSFRLVFVHVRFLSKGATKLSGEAAKGMESVCDGNLIIKSCSVTSRVKW